MSENETELVLTETGRMVMEAIQTATETHRLYGRDAAACESVFGEVSRRLIDDAPMPVADRTKYRWFLREAARLLRTRTGGDLADGYNLLLAKWKNLGLKQGRMELFLGALWDAVRPVLEAHGVPHRFWVCYYSFARRLARLRRRYGARTLEFEPVIAKNIAFARGLDDRIVEEIAGLGLGNGRTPDASRTTPEARSEGRTEARTESWTTSPA